MAECDGTDFTLDRQGSRTWTGPVGSANPVSISVGQVHSAPASTVTANTSQVGNTTLKIQIRKDIFRESDRLKTDNIPEESDLIAKGQTPSKNSPELPKSGLVFSKSYPDEPGKNMTLASPRERNSLTSHAQSESPRSPPRRESCRSQESPSRQTRSKFPAGRRNSERRLRPEQPSTEKGQPGHKKISHRTFINNLIDLAKGNSTSAVEMPVNVPHALPQSHLPPCVQAAAAVAEKERAPQSAGAFPSRAVQRAAALPSSYHATAMLPTAVPAGIAQANIAQPTAVLPTTMTAHASAIPPTGAPPTAVPASIAQANIAQPTAVLPTMTAHASAIPPTAALPTAAPPTAVPASIAQANIAPPAAVLPAMTALASAAPPTAALPSIARATAVPPSAAPQRYVQPSPPSLLQSARPSRVVSTTTKDAPLLPGQRDFTGARPESDIPMPVFPHLELCSVNQNRVELDLKALKPVSRVIEATDIPAAVPDHMIKILAEQQCSVSSETTSTDHKRVILHFSSRMDGMKFMRKTKGRLMSAVEQNCNFLPDPEQDCNELAMRCKIMECSKLNFPGGSILPAMMCMKGTLGTKDSFALHLSLLNHVFAKEFPHPIDTMPSALAEVGKFFSNIQHTISNYLRTAAHPEKPNFDACLFLFENEKQQEMFWRFVKLMKMSEKLKEVVAFTAPLSSLHSFILHKESHPLGDTADLNETLAWHSDFVQDKFPLGNALQKFMVEHASMTNLTMGKDKDKKDLLCFIDHKVIFSPTSIHMIEIGLSYRLSFDSARVCKSSFAIPLDASVATHAKKLLVTEERNGFIFMKHSSEPILTEKIMFQNFVSALQDLNKSFNVILCYLHCSVFALLKFVLDKHHFSLPVAGVLCLCEQMFNKVNLDSSTRSQIVANALGNYWHNVFDSEEQKSFIQKNVVRMDHLLKNPPKLPLVKLMSNMSTTTNENFHSVQVPIRKQFKSTEDVVFLPKENKCRKLFRIYKNLENITVDYYQEKVKESSIPEVLGYFVSKVCRPSHDWMNIITNIYGLKISLFSVVSMKQLEMGYRNKSILAKMSIERRQSCTYDFNNGCTMPCVSEKFSLQTGPYHTYIFSAKAEVDIFNKQLIRLLQYAAIPINTKKGRNLPPKNVTFPPEQGPAVEEVIGYSKDVTTFTNLDTQAKTDVSRVNPVKELSDWLNEGPSKVLIVFNAIQIYNFLQQLQVDLSNIYGFIDLQWTCNVGKKKSLQGFYDYLCKSTDRIKATDCESTCKILQSLAETIIKFSSQPNDIVGALFKFGVHTKMLQMFTKSFPNHNMINPRAIDLRSRKGQKTESHKSVNKSSSSPGDVGSMIATPPQVSVGTEPEGKADPQEAVSFSQSLASTRAHTSKEVQKTKTTSSEKSLEQMAGQADKILGLKQIAGQLKMASYQLKTAHLEQEVGHLSALSSSPAQILEEIQNSLGSEVPVKKKVGSEKIAEQSSTPTKEVQNNLESRIVASENIFCPKQIAGQFKTTSCEKARKLKQAGHLPTTAQASNKVQKSSESEVAPSEETSSLEQIAGQSKIAPVQATIEQFAGESSTMPVTNSESKGAAPKVSNEDNQKKIEVGSLSESEQKMLEDMLCSLDCLLIDDQARPFLTSYAHFCIKMSKKFRSKDIDEVLLCFSALDIVDVEVFCQKLPSASSKEDFEEKVDKALPLAKTLLNDNHPLFIDMLFVFVHIRYTTHVEHKSTEQLATPAPQHKSDEPEKGRSANLVKQDQDNYPISSDNDETNEKDLGSYLQKLIRNDVRKRIIEDNKVIQYNSSVKKIKLVEGKYLDEEGNAINKILFSDGELPEQSDFEALVIKEPLENENVVIPTGSLKKWNGFYDGFILSKGESNSFVVGCLSENKVFQLEVKSSMILSQAHSDIDKGRNVLVYVTLSSMGKPAPLVIHESNSSTITVMVDKRLDEKTKSNLMKSGFNFRWRETVLQITGESHQLVSAEDISFSHLLMAATFDVSEVVSFKADLSKLAEWKLRKYWTDKSGSLILKSNTNKALIVSNSSKCLKDQSINELLNTFKTCLPQTEGQETNLNNANVTKKVNETTKTPSLTLRKKAVSPLPIGMSFPILERNEACGNSSSEVTLLADLSIKKGSSGFIFGMAPKMTEQITAEQKLNLQFHAYFLVKDLAAGGIVLDNDILAVVIDNDSDRDLIFKAGQKMGFLTLKSGNKVVDLIESDSVKPFSYHQSRGAVFFKSKNFTILKDASRSSVYFLGSGASCTALGQEVPMTSWKIPPCAKRGLTELLGKFIPHFIVLKLSEDLDGKDDDVSFLSKTLNCMLSVDWKLCLNDTSTVLKNPKKSQIKTTNTNEVGGKRYYGYQSGKRKASSPIGNEKASKSPKVGQDSKTVNSIVSERNSHNEGASSSKSGIHPAIAPSIPDKSCLGSSFESYGLNQEKAEVKKTELAKSAEGASNESTTSVFDLATKSATFITVNPSSYGYQSGKRKASSPIGNEKASRSPNVGQDSKTVNSIVSERNSHNQGASSSKSEIHPAIAHSIPDKSCLGSSFKSYGLNQEKAEVKKTELAKSAEGASNESTTSVFDLATKSATFITVNPSSYGYQSGKRKASSPIGNEKASKSPKVGQDSKTVNSIVSERNSHNEGASSSKSGIHPAIAPSIPDKSCLGNSFKSYGLNQEKAEVKKTELAKSAEGASNESTTSVFDLATKSATSVNPINLQNQKEVCGSDGINLNSESLSVAGEESSKIQVVPEFEPANTKRRFKPIEAPPSTSTGYGPRKSAFSFSHVDKKRKFKPIQGPSSAPTNDRVVYTEKDFRILCGTACAHTSLKRLYPCPKYFKMGPSGCRKGRRCSLLHNFPRYFKFWPCRDYINRGRCLQSYCRKDHWDYSELCRQFYHRMKEVIETCRKCQQINLQRYGLTTKSKRNRVPSSTLESEESREGRQNIPFDKDHCRYGNPWAPFQQIEPTNPIEIEIVSDQDLNDVVAPGTEILVRGVAVNNEALENCKIDVTDIPFSDLNCAVQSHRVSNLTIFQSNKVFIPMLCKQPGVLTIRRGQQIAIGSNIAPVT